MFYSAHTALKSSAWGGERAATALRTAITPDAERKEKKKENSDERRQHRKLNDQIKMGPIAASDGRVEDAGRGPLTKRMHKIFERGN